MIEQIRALLLGKFPYLTESDQYKKQLAAQAALAAQMGVEEGKYAHVLQVAADMSDDDLLLIVGHNYELNPMVLEPQDRRFNADGVVITVGGEDEPYVSYYPRKHNGVSYRSNNPNLANRWNSAEANYLALKQLAGL